MSISLRGERIRQVLDAIVSVVLIVAAGILVHSSFSHRSRTTPAAVSPPKEPFFIGDAPTKGSRDARFIMIVFADVECPFCRRFAADILPELERRYVVTGRVLLAFQHLPLKMHPHAFSAALTAECARQQEKFWPVHDALFLASQLGDSVQDEIAFKAGVDVDQLHNCIKRPDSTEAVNRSADRAHALGISGTPTFFHG